MEDKTEKTNSPKEGSSSLQRIKVDVRSHPPSPQAHFPCPPDITVSCDWMRSSNMKTTAWLTLPEQSVSYGVAHSCEGNFYFSRLPLPSSSHLWSSITCLRPAPALLSARSSSAFKKLLFFTCCCPQINRFIDHSEHGESVCTSPFDLLKPPCISCFPPYY